MPRHSGKWATGQAGTMYFWIPKYLSLRPHLVIMTFIFIAWKDEETEANITNRLLEADTAKGKRLVRT